MHIEDRVIAAHNGTLLAEHRRKMEFLSGTVAGVDLFCGN